MGKRSRIKAWWRCPPPLLWVVAAALAVAQAPVGGAEARSTSLCPSGRQFWDAAQERCRECSVCREPNRVVLRPCHVLSDTRCGHVHELDMGRAWPRHRGASPVTTPAPTSAAPVAGPWPPTLTVSDPTERRLHRQRARWNPAAAKKKGEVAAEEEAAAEDGARGGGDSSGHRPAALARRVHKHWGRGNSSRSPGHNNHLKKYRDYIFLHHHHHRQKARPPESAAQLAEGPRAVAGSAPAVTAVAAAAAAESTGPAAAVAASGPGATTAAGSVSAGGFTVEELAWDWQAAVLVTAVAACALFFGAAALHGFRQLRQDARRSADADNLSATLSLMVPELVNEVPYNCSLEGYNTNKCLYIEQLLVRKNEESKEGQGNVYIDRGKGKIHE